MSSASALPLIPELSTLNRKPQALHPEPDSRCASTYMSSASAAPLNPNLQGLNTTPHTVDYEPFTKSRLASRKLTVRIF
ncbi:hypothetical protein T484DRAFT_1953690 [Baffinella frigidus]|nr:hypothetical protein T484DRAFT_1953690 [Cryptophyta sp. CCMP2293]